jgi:hypothetical protein
MCQVVIREALPKDNAALLKLTSLTPMKGRISLRIDRNPDFFRLLSKRGESKVYVAGKNGTLVGCFSVSNTETLVNGNYEKVYYLADLKIHPSYGGIMLVRLLNVMMNHLKQCGADLLFCTAAFGNEKVMPLFEGRAGFPKFHPVGTFRVFQIIPLNSKINSKKYTLDEAEINDNIISLYNRFYSGYDVAPLYSISSLQGTRTIMAIEKGTIRASVTLSDVSGSKQNVLMGLPFILNLVVMLLRFLNRIAPFINLPEIGKPVKVLYIKAFAFSAGCEDGLEFLIQKARQLAFRDRYCYLTVGIHERDPLVRFFNKYLHFTFLSLGFILSMHGNDEKINKIFRGVLFEDYSLV